MAYYIEFTAQEDFWIEELQSAYGKGLSYTVRPAEAYDHSKMPEKVSKLITKRCEFLATQIPIWLKEGKIKLGREGSSGSVRGQG